MDCSPCLLPLTHNAGSSATGGVLRCEKASSVHRAKCVLTPASEVASNKVAGKTPRSCSSGSQWEQLVAAQPGKGLHLLYLFSGAEDRSDGINTYVQELGASIECYDKRYISDDKHDLCDDDNWQPIKSKLDGKKYHGGLASPPCRSMSELRERSNKDGGPRPLRGPEPPELYGFSHLFPEEKELVRCDNLLFARSGYMAQSFLDCGPTIVNGNKRWLPWLLEQPLFKPERPHAFKLKWIAPLAAHESVIDENIAQCNAGSLTTKPTTLRSTFKTNIPADCPHEAVWWTIPWSGRSYLAPHPKLFGRQWPVRSEDWDSSMLERFEPRGPYISDSAAAYPGKMNKIIALKMVLLAKMYMAGMTAKASTMLVESGKWHNSLVAPHLLKQKPNEDSARNFTVSLRQNPVFVTSRRDAEDAMAIGGLRNPSESIQKLGRHKELGKVISKSLDHYLDNNPDVEDACYAAIGSTAENPGPSIHCVDEVRGIIGKLVQCSDLSEVRNDQCQTSIRAGLLGSWARCAKDPAQVVESWCREGAPGNILHFFPDDGIFPRTNPEDVTPPDELTCDLDNFVNYEGFDDDEDAYLELQSFIQCEPPMLAQFDTLDECREFLQAEPVLSRFGLIVRNKDGKIKKRIILDEKQSGVTGSTRRTHRLLLPRGSDVTDDNLELSHDLGADEEVEQMVLDVRNAFWLVPNKPSERRFCVGMVRGKYVVYLRTPQGSRGAPFSWGYLFALVSRCTQSLVDPRHGRLQVYVDDPHLSVRGPPWMRRRIIAKVVITWMALGFALAFDKGQKGVKVGWIGAVYNVTRTQVEVEIKEERSIELEQLTLQHELGNVISLSDLKTYAGKCQSFSGVIPSWRPFIHDLYGVIYQDASGALSSKAPRNCVWTLQILHVLKWIKAFLFRQTGATKRVYRIDAYFWKGTQLKLTLDASPWGLGATLSVDEVYVCWYAVPLTKVDAARFKVKLGDAEGQQLWESLNVLVALRVWQSWWRRKQVCLEVKSDNVTALSLLCKLKGGSASLNIIARELALDFGDCSYRPTIVTHAPGISLKTVDTLSRRFQPKVNFKLPHHLQDVPEAHPPEREDKFFQALFPPEVSQRARRDAKGVTWATSTSSSATAEP